MTKSGKPTGVLLAIDSEEELERLILAYSPRLRTIPDAARKRIRAGAFATRISGMSWKE